MQLIIPTTKQLYTPRLIPELAAACPQGDTMMMAFNEGVDVRVECQCPHSAEEEAAILAVIEAHDGTPPPPPKTVSELEAELAAANALNAAQATALASLEARVASLEGL